MGLFSFAVGSFLLSLTGTEERSLTREIYQHNSGMDSSCVVERFDFSAMKKSVYVRESLGTSEVRDKVSVVFTLEGTVSERLVLFISFSSPSLNQI